MEIMESYMENEVRLLVEDIIDEPDHDIVHELQEIVFKLRSYSEPTGGDYSMGFESGLEMASAIIENLLVKIGEKRGS
jgi:hypothetical protein